MRIVIFLVAGALALAACEADAQAEECISAEACDTARERAEQPSYTGPIAETTAEMVCLHAIASEPTELVLAEGFVPAGAAVTGRVLTSWRVQEEHWQRWSRDPTNVWVREICIQRSMIMHSVAAATLCSGTEVGDGHRSVWGESDIRYLLETRRIEESDPACLLGNTPCADYGL